MIRSAPSILASSTRSVVTDERHQTARLAGYRADPSADSAVEASGLGLSGDRAPGERRLQRVRKAPKSTVAHGEQLTATKQEYLISTINREANLIDRSKSLV